MLVDRKEQIFLIEPMLLSDTFKNRAGLFDLPLSSIHPLEFTIKRLSLDS